MAKVSFLGLGVMGYPMAGHLKKAGHEVCVYNRTLSRAKQWFDEYKGTYQETPQAAVRDADFVFACVGNDKDITEVASHLEYGAFYGMKKGSIFIDHTTASAKIARQLAEQAKDLGLEFMDAPVSGGQAGAENGKLTIMCGAKQQVFDRVEPIIKAYGKYCGLIGDIGAGQLTKMVNQICVVGLVQALAEGINFGICSGLDMQKVFQAISEGASASWQMNNRFSTMVAGKFDFGFAVDWMRKDLKICFEQAQENGAKLPITEIIDSYYGQIQKKGGNRYDTSSLILNLNPALKKS